MQVNASAMMSMTAWMNNSANNVANVNTSDYGAIQTTIDNNGVGVVAQSSKTESRTDLAKEMTDQISIEKSVEANAEAIKTQDKMIGSLLDLTI